LVFNLRLGKRKNTQQTRKIKQRELIIRFIFMEDKIYKRQLLL